MAQPGNGKSTRAKRPRQPASQKVAPDGAGAPSADASGPAPPICQVALCPLCTVVTAVGELKPEVLDHLLLAGREVLLAVRALIDARLEGQEPSPSSKLQRLTIE